MKYEIRKREDGKVAIFDENGRMVSPEWFDEIWKDGLVKGQSIYYIAIKDGKEAIFDENGKMISPEWFDEIHPYGLVRGQSPYHTDIRFVSNPYRDVINFVVFTVSCSSIRCF